MEQNPSQGTLPPGFSFITFDSDAVLPDLTPPPQTKLICITTAYGDTLSGIAALFGTTVEDIARMNRIADPDRIFPGMRLYLRIPASVPIAACETYTVRPGDTLSGIANRLGLELDALIEANQLENPDFILPGQVLRI